jgi:small-conductance mechanosensitive channel
MQSPIKVLRLFTLLALFAPVACFAQAYPEEPARQAAACGCCGMFLLIPIAFLAISIALLVWVARDAKARGMDSAVVWMLVVFFLNLIGLVIYLLSRPQGDLFPCPNCGNMRLLASVRCPHCGIGS